MLLNIEAKAAIVALGGYDLFYLITIISFFLLRAYPNLRFRSPLLTILQSFASFIIINISLLRYVLIDNFPCWLQIWVEAFVFPTLYFTLLVRYVMYGRQYWINMHQFSTCNTENVLKETAEEDEKRFSGFDMRQQDPALVYRVLSRRRLRFLSWFNQWVVIIFALLLFALQVVSVFLAQFKFGLGQLAAPDCAFTPIQRLPIYLGVGCTLFLIPAALTAVWNVADNYGIKVELHANAVIILVTYVMSAVLDFSHGFSFLVHVRRWFNSINVIVVGLLALHIITVCIPTMEAYIARLQLRKRTATYVLPSAGQNHRNSVDSLEFERTVSDPSLWADFKAFFVKELRVEYVLFYERYVNAKKMAARDDPNWRTEYRSIFQDFLAPRASMPLEITQWVLTDIRTTFRKMTDSFAPEALDRPAMEVRMILYAEPFPRFLEQSKKNRKSVP